jgi:hypothetical protein
LNIEHAAIAEVDVRDVFIPAETLRRLASDDIMFMPDDGKGIAISSAVQNHHFPTIEQQAVAATQIGILSVLERRLL